MSAETDARSVPLTANEQAQAVYKAIFTFKEDTGLTYEDLSEILGKDGSTWKRWNRDKAIPLKDKHLREAVSHFIAIFRSLGAMFGNKNDRTLWLKTEHPDFEKSPLALMMQDFRGLIQVRTYLDYVRGRGA
ncbi:MAG: DUF2384 domain-containing protein [Oligoflexus sp.]|nr:DUF2384 domain-containing protein [Oligoflexus sp.]